MTNTLTTPIPAGAGQRAEPAEQDICAQCEFWECTECFQILDETPAAGCCCGAIPATQT